MNAENNGPILDRLKYQHRIGDAYPDRLYPRQHHQGGDVPRGDWAVRRIDSALSAYLAATALGAENVLALRMPYKTSSADSLNDAEAVIEDLGLPNQTLAITEMADPLIERFPDMSKLRRGNIMARMRMVTLYDQSMAWGGLVMGTSNKTEFLLGYSTIYGDSGVALHPIADLYKCQVRQLARSLGVPVQLSRSRPPPICGWGRQTKLNSASPTTKPIKC